MLTLPEMIAVAVLTEKITSRAKQTLQLHQRHCPLSFDTFFRHDSVGCELAGRDIAAGADVRVLSAYNLYTFLNKMKCSTPSRAKPTLAAHRRHYGIST